MCQASKFAERPDVQQRIVEAPSVEGRDGHRRTLGIDIDTGWNAQRVDVMRWVLRMNRQVNATKFDAVLSKTDARPIDEISPRDRLVRRATGRRPVRWQKTSSAGFEWSFASCLGIHSAAVPSLLIR